MEYSGLMQRHDEEEYIGKATVTYKLAHMFRWFVVHNPIFNGKKPWKNDFNWIVVIAELCHLVPNVVSPHKVTNIHN